MKEVFLESTSNPGIMECSKGHPCLFPMPRHEIDCRRLLCPMPVIRVQDRVAELAPGDELVAVCTDPGALSDIPAWCRINGHRVLEKYSAEDEHMVVVQVGSKAI